MIVEFSALAAFMGAAPGSGTKHMFRAGKNREASLHF